MSSNSLQEIGAQLPSSIPQDIAISVRHLTKTYRLFNHPGDRIKQFFALGLRRYHGDFTALNDVSFDIRKGDTVGIVGRNGSGKSTLLQLICGILKPTSGSIKVNGRISALLELGAGFNPEFTGRENVYFQGALMGFTRDQMEQRFAEIAAFAGIGEFIDQPVRTYSSGMFVRLAFSVAINVDPEILVIDEALGVGDSEFQERSIARMQSMQRNGVTILFVSHSIPAVRNFCRQLIWLNGGTLQEMGPTNQVCLAYMRSASSNQRDPSGNHAFSTKGQGNAKAISIANVGADKQSISVGESLTLRVSLAIHSKDARTSEFGLGVIIRNQAGAITTIFNTIRDDLYLSETSTEITLNLPRCCFIPNKYFVSINVCDSDALYSFDEWQNCITFDVKSEFSHKLIPRWEGDVACEHVWNF